MTRTRRPRKGLVLALAVLLAGCGGGDEQADPMNCRPDGQPLAREAKSTSVAQAVARNPSGQVRVTGSYLKRGKEPALLCARLRQTTPRQCIRPALTTDGLGNAKRLFQQIETTPGTPPVSFAEQIFVPGRLDGDTIRVEPACSTRAVLDHFEAETDQKLQLDLLSSDDSAEHINFEALEDEALARQRRQEWGTMDIVVSIGGEQLGLDQALVQIAPVAEVPNDEPDANGIVWARIQGGPWLALSEYDDNVVLTWLAGPQQRIDDRWRKLDETLSELG